MQNRRCVVAVRTKMKCLIPIIALATLSFKTEHIHSDDRNLLGLTPRKMMEELMRKKFRAKCQFRAFVRKVIANLYWLAESVDTYSGDNVKKRVEQAMRAPGKKMGLLNFHDKALLSKPAEDRTEAEKRYIYRIIGGLKCFKRYPNVVKKAFAAKTYFRYYGPGRVIVRENDEAHASYFIMAGDVIVSKLILDEMLNKYNNIDVGVMMMGNMFGEVSLLHNIPRTATCTTFGHCELLMLMKDDFKSVLQEAVQKEWDAIKQAMKAFTYFDSFDPVSQREACIVSKLKAFKAGATILGDGSGTANYIHFVLSGKCHMIETLQVIPYKGSRGSKRYRLYDPYVAPPVTQEDEPDFDKKYFDAYKLKARNASKAETTKSDQASVAGTEILDQTDDETSKNYQADDEASKLDQAEDQTSKLNEGDDETSKLDQVDVKSSNLGTNASESVHPSKASEDKTNDSVNTSATKITAKSHVSAEKSTKLSKEKEEEAEKPTNLSKEEEDDKEMLKISSESFSVIPENIETHFMQACIFLPGASFGFEEEWRDRRIVAMTDVDCLLMPKVWLFQRNIINIWSRIQHYLETKIPTKKELFEHFVLERKWMQYKETIIEDVVSRSQVVNYTTKHDVPYSIRLDEQLDI